MITEATPELGAFSVWQELGISKNLGGMEAREAALDAIEERMSLEGARVLDLGGGTGPTGRLATERGANVIELDSNPFFEFEAQRRSKKSRDQFVDGIIADANMLPLANASIDAVIAEQLLSQGTVRPDDALKEVYRILKPQGVLVVNEMYFELEMPAQLRRFLSNNRSVFFNGGNYFDNPFVIQQMLENNNFRDVDFSVMKFNLGNQLRGYQAVDGAPAHIKAAINGMQKGQTRNTLIKLVTAMPAALPYLRIGITSGVKSKA